MTQTSTVPAALTTATTHPSELGWDPDAARQLDWQAVARNAADYTAEIPRAGRVPADWEEWI